MRGKKTAARKLYEPRSGLVHSHPVPTAEGAPVTASFLLLAVAAAADPAGFTPLVGRDLTGWTVLTKAGADGSETWTVTNGVLATTGKPTGCLLTVAEYADYTLRLDYRLLSAELKRPNSGVLLHCQPGDQFWPHSLEVQLAKGEAGDVWLQPAADKSLPRIDTAAERFDPANKDKRHYFRDQAAVEKSVGEWNALEVTTRGGSVTVTLNGVPAFAAAGGSLTKGRIGLQAEGSAAEFRRVLIRVHRP